MLTALLCAHLLSAPLPPDSAVLLVRVLDVSNAKIGGDAILITDSSQGRAQHVLIDASDDGPTIVRALRRFRVDTLAALVLSHPHVDHYGGMFDVVRRVVVRSFVYGGTPRTSPTYLGLLRRIAALHIAVVTVDTGSRRVSVVAGHDSVVLTVFAPPPSCHTLAARASGDEINNCSLGILLSRGAFHMLLPGDAEQSELGWWFMTARAPLRADILKAGHHGSSNAVDATLLDAVRPKAVLISANGRQHPFAQVLDLLEARGIPTYCTADMGTITVRVPRHHDWTITPERAGRCHSRTVLTTGGP